MSIRDEAARAEALSDRQYGKVRDERDRKLMVGAFIIGAKWEREQALAQELTDAHNLVAVSWTDCDCEWGTSYCDEYHRRTTRIPRSVLARAARRDEEKK